MHFFLKIRKQQHEITGILAFAVFFITGSVLVSLNNPLRDKFHYFNTTISSENNTLLLTITEELKPGFYAGKYVAEVNQINSNRASGIVLLNLTRDTLNNKNSLARVDDRIVLKGTLNLQNRPPNPYQFDYAAYLKKRGIYAQITSSQNEFRILKNRNSTLKGFAAQSRNYLNNKLSKFNFQTDSKAVLNALLLGQRQELSADLQTSYINAGVIHILAVSGLHVGILMLLVQFLLKPLGNFKSSKLIRCILIIVIIWAFAIFTGSSPSVLRAATMFSLIQIGILFNQRQASMNALIISAFLLILLKPNLIYEVGFQLSYAAVFFIIWLYPKFEKLGMPKNKILKYYWQLVLVSLCAQVGVLPLSLYYFHQFPGLFLIANLIILPFIGFLLIFGIVVLILAALNLLPQQIATVYDYALSLLNDFIRYLAGFDSFLITNIYFSAALIFICYALIFSFGKLLSKLTYTRIVLCLVTLITLPLTLIIAQRQQAQSSFYVVHRYNSSLFIQRNTNRNLIIFTSEEQNELGSILPDFEKNLVIEEIHFDKLKHYYTYKEKKILRLDSLGIYEISNLKPDYIVLTQSPKINLDRLLERFPEVAVIADGSNYKSYAARWEETCRKNKIPFHNTYEKGFYKIE